MSKKHYVKLAEIINLARPYTEGCEQAERIVRDIAGSLASYCASENRRFDRGRFLAACGYHQN